MDQKILDALKTINDKLGGTNDPNENWGSLLQEIAQNVESGGGGSVFVEEFVWTDNVTIGAVSYNGYVSADSYETIVSNYLSGKTVIFHIPRKEGYEGEWYLTMNGYTPNTGWGGDTNEISLAGNWYPNSYGPLTAFGDTITDDGKLMFYFYSD